MDLPHIHIAVIQPAGYVHSLGMLDQARYARHMLRLCGAEATIAKNRLREDAINIVMGAHLGFDPALRQRYVCAFFNLDQLGQNGAKTSQAYLDLLGRSAAIDYHPDNVAIYTPHVDDVPVVPFLYADYLRPSETLPLSERPIDLLFIGTMNDRRREYIDRVEACGVNVTVFDGPLYCEERDHYIRQSKAVLNCHYYALGRFEQPRASIVLSMGTPIISERQPHTTFHPAFSETVEWVSPERLERFFRHEFNTPAWEARAQAQLEQFRHCVEIEPWADLVGFLQSYHQTLREHQLSSPWQPKLINLGSGRDYRLGALNLDVMESSLPDLVLDLSKPLTLPLHTRSANGADLILAEQSVSHVVANNVLEHVADLPQLMSNLLRLLETGGTVEIDVPYEKSLSAWQDPTHVRALNENSWLYYTDWFWYLGWFEHRFEIAQAAWLDMKLAPCQKEQAAFMKLVLKKIATSARERTTARVMRADCGGIPADAWPGVQASQAAMSPAHAAPPSTEVSPPFALESAC